MLEFNNKQQLMKYTSKMKHRLEEGETCALKQEKKTYVWKEGAWEEVKLQLDSNVKMTMYELNEQLIQQLPNYTEKQLQEGVEVINKFYEIDKADYYMLLCKEHSYFTILRKDDTSARLGSIIAELLNEMDLSIRSVENLNNSEIEIWCADSNNIWCLHLFNYDRGIVNFGG